MFPFLDIEAKMLKERERAEGFRQLFHMQDIVAAGEFRFQCKMHVGAHFRRFVQYFEFIKHLYPALSPADRLLAVKRAQLLDDCLLVSDFLLLFHIGAVLGCPQRFLPGGVIGVVSGKDSGPGVIQLDHFIGDPVQKITVMGYDDHGAPVVEQVGLQPGDGGHVQMVGRLVQYDQVWFE